jgi:uridine kinase
MNIERIVIGIAGGTGAGKTTISKRLCDPVPERAVAVLEHDAYYRDRPELSLEDRAGLNYDHPDSLDNELVFQHLAALKSGVAVEKPVYDFVTHRRRPETVRVEPRPVIIIEGILIFVEKRLRDLMDIKVFVDTDPDIRILRRIRRDMSERGRSFESIRQQYYSTVRPMHLEFVEPTKRYADLIIPEGNGGNLDTALDILSGRVRNAYRQN